MKLSVMSTLRLVDVEVVLQEVKLDRNFKKKNHIPIKRDEIGKANF